jgi:uncharacterized membrane protein
MSSRFRPIRTTIVGGLMFLVPFAIIVIVLAKVHEIMVRIAEPMSRWIPLDAIGGIAIANILAVLLLLIICYAVGHLATSQRASALQRRLEERLLLIFPRYSFVKSVAEGFDSNDMHRTLKPVVVQLDDLAQPAFEVERDAEHVVVFLPGSPDPLSGTVAIVSADRVRALNCEFKQLLRTLRSAGRGSLKLLGVPSCNSAGVGRDVPRPNV